MTTVVVSGLPRSGTSMMMQMLAAGGVPPLADDSRAADPDNPRGYFELDAVKRLATDASPLLSAEGRAVKVIHRLLQHLPAGPAYAVVFLHRDPTEVLASQRTMLVRLGRDGAKLNAERLRSVYENEVKTAVGHVRTRVDATLLELDHAQVIADPRVAADRVAAFLSVAGFSELDAAAMAAAVDPTLYRQRT